ncbi:MAG: 3-hydroxyacyl-CoA dehydrogenase NAD-binding domain-containing protein, partial [Bacteroidota bacterium]
MTTLGANARIGVLGAGSMGAGIAQLAATKGHEVVLSDAYPEALESARAKLEKILNRLVEKGRIDADTAAATLGRITFADNNEAFAGCDLFIEAIVENLEVKQQVFRTMEDIL